MKRPPTRYTLFPYTTLFRSKIIWHKPNCMPSSAKDRYTNDYEYVYFFTKTQNYYFKTQYDRYTKPLNRWGGKIHRSEEHTSELQSLAYLVCRLLLEKKK